MSGNLVEIVQGGSAQPAVNPSAAEAAPHPAQGLPRAAVLFARHERQGLNVSQQLDTWDIELDADILRERELQDIPTVVLARPGNLQIDLPQYGEPAISLGEIPHEGLVEDRAGSILVTPAMMGHDTEERVCTWGIVQLRRKREKLYRLRMMPEEDEEAKELYYQYPPRANREAELAHTLLQYSRAEDYLKSTTDDEVRRLAAAAVRHYHDQSVAMRESMEAIYPGLADQVQQKTRLIRMAAAQRR